MSIITLKDWYQFDFKIKSPLKDLKAIDMVMVTLKKEGLISKWFFLFEGKVIRIRMASLDKKELEKRLKELLDKHGLEFSDTLQFSEYAEGSETLFNEEVVKRFANIMVEVTQLTIKKIKENTKFDTYRLMERLSHCLFNNMASLSFKTEEHFLAQRIKERLGQEFDGDFENKILEKK